MAIWQVYGEELLTSDLDGSTLRVSQKVKLNDNVVLRAIRCWVINYNSNAWTSLTFKIYSDRNGSPGKLLFTSTTAKLKSELFTDTYGVVESFWKFDDVSLIGTDYYHFVPEAVGYTYSSGAHLAWKRGYPDSVYRLNNPQTSVNLITRPFDIYFIAADL